MFIIVIYFEQLSSYMSTLSSLSSWGRKFWCLPVRP